MVTLLRPVVLTAFATALFAAPSQPTAGTFETAVQPVLKQSCTMCHNEKLQSGGLDLKKFLDASSIAANREGWARIVSKVHSGEMPPKGVPHPSAETMDAFVNYVEGEFDRMDRAAKPDPGRVVARRLNRAEYANTVRDLLGVHFSASDEFPPDDSGYGFDNIGAVLTMSPVLMQKYLAAAEKISSRAVGGDPLPKAGLFNMRSRILRKDVDTIEATDRVEWDAEYIVRALITGHRGPEGKPVTLVITVDGKPLKTAVVQSARTEVTRLASSTQRTSEEVRVYLPEGPHTFRAAFVNDDFFPDIKNVRAANHMDANKNMFPESIEIAGPFPTGTQQRARNKFLVCDPASGMPCVERILGELAHRAYRRPATPSEVAELGKVAKTANAAGYTLPQSLQFGITAMLVSPQFLFRMEHDPRPGAVARVSDVELASRLSYFLWSSTPDEELLRLGETNRLHQPAVLDAQIKRMLNDARSAALAENFAGQWLETRSLDAAKPDPKKFPDLGTSLARSDETETRMFFKP